VAPLKSKVTAWQNKENPSKAGMLGRAAGSAAFPLTSEIAMGKMPGLNSNIPLRSTQNGNVAKVVAAELNENKKIA